MSTRKLVLALAVIAVAVPSVYAGDEWKDEMHTTCAWLNVRQDVGSGALVESEYFDYVYLMDTCRALWVWSHYQGLTGDATFKPNLDLAWGYVLANDPKLDSTFYIQLEACGWTCGGEMAYSNATGDTQYEAFAETLADHVISSNPDFGISMQFFSYAEAVYWIYQWALDRGDDARRIAAVSMARDIQQQVEADPSLLNLESAETNGGMAYAAIVTAAFDGQLETRKSWVETYSPNLESLLTHGLYANCHNNWYLLSHQLTWEYAGEASSHAEQYTIQWNQAGEDGDHDGAIPRRNGDAVNRDGTWSSEVYVMGAQDALLHDFDVTLSTSQVGVTPGNSLFLDFGLANNQDTAGQCFVAAFMKIPGFGTVFLGVFSYLLPAGYGFALNDLALPVDVGSPSGTWELSVQIYDPQPQLSDEAILAFQVY